MNPIVKQTNFFGKLAGGVVYLKRQRIESCPPKFLCLSLNAAIFMAFLNKSFLVEYNNIIQFGRNVNNFLFTFAHEYTISFIIFPIRFSSFLPGREGASPQVVYRS